nr:pentatricopeptide repeat-containing protein At1g52640, mitochondrial-like [Ipomoea batatas]
MSTRTLTLGTRSTLCLRFCKLFSDCFHFQHPNPRNPQSFLSSPPPTTARRGGNHHCRPFTSTSHLFQLQIQSQLQSSDPSSPHLVNELSRVLSDFRSPHHDIEAALSPFHSQISVNVVEQVLKRCRNLGFSAHRFFLWAQRLPGFRHSEESYRILVDILGGSKQFPLLWDFLLEMRDAKSCEITPHMFSIVFRAYCRANLPDDAIRAFSKMGDFGIEPNVDDLGHLLYALCKRKHTSHAQKFFDRVKESYPPCTKCYSILIRGWGEMGKFSQAQKLFDEMLQRGCSVHLPAYNCLLESLCKGGKMDEAYKMFRKMWSMELKPDAFTYSIFIHSYCQANDIHSAFKVLDRMKMYDLVPNVFTYNCMIKKLCGISKVEDAYQLLDEMVDRGAVPDSWSYNTILAFHCDHNEVNQAFRLISRMDQCGCQPDRHTYNMVLKMLIRVGRFDRVEEVWDGMEKRGYYPSVSTYAVMVHGLCQKRGKLEEACKYFEMMIDEGIPPYTSTCELLRNKLIGLGFADETDILADKMERSTSCSIQELAGLMRGNRRCVKHRDEGEYSDDSDAQ